uniref:Cytochrome P450 monooxygenase penQ n=1 Tax=Penicillium crustosum TaxID=36656 RepID=PENQ_PENCR|nr:RecName: Full=Cytochrome P450 monooxygenase penQ; AltName: Full=Penitrem biosynthesis cluster protein Q [Penicillium crustosum]AGZ20192.1 cytochrome P450 monooxygenase [Penicillium crustosum]
MDYVTQSPWIVTLIVAATTYCTLRWVQYWRSWVNVPVVGRRGFLGSWISTILWTWEARGCIQKGYEKNKDFAFQVSTPNGWEVCICNDDMIKEYKNLMDDQMSALAVTSETFQAKYTLPGADWDAVHKLVPQPALAKSLMWLRNRAANDTDPYFADFVKTFQRAFKEEIQVEQDGAPFPCFPRYSRIVAALTVKALLGSLENRPELIDLLCEYAEAIPLDGFFIALFPAVLKPIVAFFCKAPRLSDRLVKVITEEIARRELENKHRIPEDMTDWMAQWVKDNPGYCIESAVVRVIATFFGGIHTTTQLTVHTLLEIATRPEYVDPLRQEITTALKTHGGWNKSAIESMTKLDSFIKEAQRFNPLDAASLARQATRDFQFSNGLKLPRGTWVFAPNGPMLFDESLYPAGSQFDGLRFWKLAEQTQKPHDYRLVTASSKYLQFGDGRHTCPGRFMAADEIRLIVAHTLFHFDIAIKNHGPRPRNTTFKKICFPDMAAEIMLRPRKPHGSDGN